MGGLNVAAGGVGKAESVAISAARGGLFGGERERFEAHAACRLVVRLVHNLS